MVLYEFWVLELTQYGYEERMGMGWRKENKCFLTVSWLNLVSKDEFSRVSLWHHFDNQYTSFFPLVPLCSCLSNEHGKEGNWHFLRICYMSGIYATLFYIRQPYGELFFLFYSRPSWDAKRWSYLPKVTW